MTGQVGEAIVAGAVAMDQPAASLPAVAVIIPAYKPGEQLPRLIEEIPDWVTFILVVDDGSPEPVALEPLVRIDSRVRLISRQRNEGVGAAVLSGYEAAAELGAEILVKMDCDGQMDPCYLGPLIAPILSGRADYVKANRFLHTRQLKSMPLSRRVGNAGLSFLTKLASGYWNVFDPTNGYTALHRSMLPLLDHPRLARGYFFETSLLLQLSLVRAVVADVFLPAKYADEVSGLSETKAFVEFPARLLAGFVRRVWTNYFIRDFTLVSLYLATGLTAVCFGLGWGIWHWVQGSQTNTPEPTGTVMVAILPLILGFQLLLQAASLDVQSTPAEPIHVRDLTTLRDLHKAPAAKD